MKHHGLGLAAYRSRYQATWFSRRCRRDDSSVHGQRCAILMFAYSVFRSTDCVARRSRFLSLCPPTRIMGQMEHREPLSTRVQRRISGQRVIVSDLALLCLEKSVGASNMQRSEGYDDLCQSKTGARERAAGCESNSRYSNRML